MKAIARWIAGKFGDVGQRIRDFIVEAIDNVTDWAQSGFDWIMQQINNVIAFSTSWFLYLQQLANDLFNSLRGVVDVLVNQIYAWARSWFDYVVWYAERIRDTLYDWALTALNGLWDGIRSTWDWVLRDIWNPLFARITGVWDWIVNELPGYVGRAIDNAVTFVRRLIGDAVNWAEGRVRQVIDWISPVVDIVHRAWTWLVWFARNPLDTVEHWVEGLSKRTAKYWLARIMDAFLSEGDELEQMAARWIRSSLLLVTIPTVIILYLYRVTARGRKG